MVRGFMAYVGYFMVYVGCRGGYSVLEMSVRYVAGS